MNIRKITEVLEKDTFKKLSAGLVLPKAMQVLVCVFFGLYLTVYAELYVLDSAWKCLIVFGGFLAVFGILTYAAGRFFRLTLRPDIVLLSIAAAALILAGCKNMLFPPEQDIYISLTAETAGEICLCDVVVDGENIPVGQAEVVENSGWLYREQYDNFVIWPKEDGTENRLTLHFSAAKVHLGFPYTPYAGSVSIESSVRGGGTWDLRCPERDGEEEVQYADLFFRRPYSLLEPLVYGLGILSILVFFSLHFRKWTAKLKDWIVVWTAKLKDGIVIWKSLPSGVNKWLVAYAILLSATVVVGGKMNMEGSPWFQPIEFADFFKFLLLFFVLSAAGSFLIKLGNVKGLIAIHTERISKKWWLCAWLLLAVLWTPYLLAYYPGLLSPDSFTSLLQVKNLKLLYNHVPIAYTLLIALFARIGWDAGDANFGIFLFTVVQTLIMAGVLSYSAYWLRKKVRNRIAAAAILLFYGLNPIVALYSMTMWKDVLYSAWIVLLCLFLFDMAMCRGEELKDKKRLAQLGVLFLLISFGRNNGIYVAFFCWLSFLLFYKKAGKKLLAAEGSVILAILLIQGPVYKELGINQAGFAESVGIPLQQICYTVVKDGLPEGEEQEFLENIIPIEAIEKSYSPISVDNIKFHEQFNTVFFEQNKGGFIRLYLKLLPSHFQSYVQAYLLSTAGFWHIEPNGWITHENIYENDMGIYNVDYFQKYFHCDMKERVSGKIASLKNSPITNVGFMVWFTFFYVIACLSQKQPWKAVLALPLIGCWLTLMLATPVNAQFRYVYYYHLMLPVVGVMLFMKRGDEQYTSDLQTGSQDEEKTERL